MASKQKPAFQDSIQVTTPNRPITDYNKNFSAIYNALYRHLSRLSFVQQKYHSLQQEYNSFSSSNTDTASLPLDLDLSDDDVITIYKYIEKLCKEPYITMLMDKKIPSRPAEPENYSQMSNEEQQKYIEQLAKADIKIRLMTYLKELVSASSLYLNHSFRDYYMYICSYILFQYSKSHSNELTNIHFRFKSPRGLIIKIAKKIILDGYYHRDPKTRNRFF